MGLGPGSNEQIAKQARFDTVSFIIFLVSIGSCRIHQAPGPFDSLVCRPQQPVAEENGHKVGHQCVGAGLG